MNEPNTNNPNEPQEELTAQQMNDLLQVRRDKLTALCEAGQNPFEITKYAVSAHNADIRVAYEEMEAEYIAANGAPEEWQALELPEPLKVSVAEAFRNLRPPSARSLPTVSAPPPENVE